MKSLRKSNFELLRVIAMLMVTTLHALGHGGVLAQYEFGTIGYSVYQSIESMCDVAVNVFVLITGYFMVTSTVKPSRLVNLFLQVEFYSILCLLVSKYIFRQPIGLKNILNAIFPISSGSYWFVSAYVVLIALVPLINRFIRSMNRQQHFMTIVLLTGLFCIMPTFMFWSRDILGNGYNFIWFIVLYTTSAYIRLYSDEIPRKHKSIKCALLYLILSGGGTLGGLIIGFISLVVFGELHGENLFIAYNSVTVFPASVCLFMAFKYLDIKNKIMEKVSASLGALCFGIYLATDNTLIREQLWKTINLPGLYKYGSMIQLGFTVLVIISLFTAGCLLEKARMMIFRITRAEKIYGYIDNKFAKIIAVFKTTLEKRTDV